MAYFFGFDFDGTIISTKKNPFGVGVAEAYELAIHTVLGSSMHSFYLEQGGLKNRAPSQLVNDLLDSYQDQTPIAVAHDFFLREHTSLNDLVPQGKGVPLVWNEQNPKPIITELLARKKLQILNEFVSVYPDGTMWPQLESGFWWFWSALHLIKEEHNVTTAVISSGHETFIKKAFKLWSMELPDILVTEDDIRGRRNPLNKASDGPRYKPGQLPLALAHYEWLRRRDFVTQDTPRLIARARQDKSHMIYFGDSQEHDGELARRAGITFGLRTAQPSHETGVLEFSDWGTVLNQLSIHTETLRGERPIDEIFFAHQGMEERSFRQKEG